MLAIPSFSGVAYAHVREDSRPNNISVISQWRGVRNASPYERVKVPTKIWYKPSGDILWGYEVPEEGDPIEWFKLLLVEESDLGEKLRGSENTKIPRNKLAVLKKDVTTVVADYCKWSLLRLVHLDTRGDEIVELTTESFYSTPAMGIRPRADGERAWHNCRGCSLDRRFDSPSYLA